MDFDFTTGIIQNVNSTDGMIVIGGTGGLQVPTGSTAQRPASAGNGTLRINSSLSTLEYYNNGVWSSFAGGVTSVALTLPSFFSVTGSPITNAGTITASLVSQPANSILASPAGSAGAPSFRTLSLASGDMSDVAISSPTTQQALLYNGTKWVNSSVTNGAVTGILNSWSATGGSPARWTASFNHGLGTFSVIINLYDTATNQMIIPDKIQLTDGNNVLVTVGQSGRSLRIVVIANGANIGGGGSSSLAIQNSTVPLSGSYSTLNFSGGITASDSGGGITTIAVPNNVANVGGSPSLQQDVLANRPAAGTPGRIYLATDNNTIYRDNGTTWIPLNATSLRAVTYVAASLDTPNSADWVINSLAPAVADASYNSLTVRSFDQTTEQGIGLLITPPTTATGVTFTFKGRPATAPGATAIVQLRVYRRQFPNGSAPGAWGSAVDLPNITIPTNAYFQYASQTVSLATLGWTAGQMTLVEITRRTTGLTGGTNLAAAYLLSELTLEFN